MRATTRPVRLPFTALLMTALALPAGLVLHAGQVRGDDGGPPPIRIARASDPIVVDGVVNDAAWAGAVSVPLPYEVDPGENIDAPVETECRLAYDEGALFLAFIARDPAPGEIRARLTDRDNNYGDDQVGVMLDCFNDERRAFEFFANPLGVQSDMARNDLATDEAEDATWDAIWDSAGRITEEGYVVEMAIPFNSLRFPATSGEQKWGIQLFRNYPRKVRHQIGSHPFDRGRSCMVCQYAKLEGLAGIAPGRNLEVAPTLTTHRLDSRSAIGMDEGEFKGEWGVSARWGITPNVSVNGTVNPDFSQVEADAAQLSVNTRYALFYPEKRPFFLEGADFLATPIQAVYTRTVAEPHWGAKVSGKSARHAMSAFLARDDRTNLLFPSNRGSDATSLDQDVTEGVLRYRMDIGEGSTLGLLGTLREGDGYHNRVYGADGLLRVGECGTIVFQGLGSSTEYLPSLAERFGQPQGPFGGFGGLLGYRHSGRDWSIWSEAQSLESGLRADAGFLPRVDLREWEGGIERSWFGERGAWLTRASAGVEARRAEDQNGHRTDEALELFGAANGPWQSYARPTVELSRETYEGKTFEKAMPILRLGIRPNATWNFWGAGGYGDGIDYANARRGKSLWGGPGFSIDLGRHVQFFIDHTLDHLTTGGKRIYTANLLQSRLVYQWNVRFFVRGIFQYTIVDRNPSLYRNPVPAGDRELFSQLLAAYKINPQTVCYLGYAEDRAGGTAPRLRLQTRTFFAKIGYAWLL